MMHPNDAPPAALIALAVETQFAWETAQELAAAKRRAWERAWSAALTDGHARFRFPVWS